MKSTILNLNKRVLVVEFPRICNYQVGNHYLRVQLENGDSELIYGKYDIICGGSELSEEIASKFCESHYTCFVCGGDGKETCTNPDHGFISGMSFNDVGRLGCPVCGHNENHKVKNGGDCECCNGMGKLSSFEFLESSNEYMYDDEGDFHSALDSFISAIEANNFYWKDNPLGDEPRSYSEIVDGVSPDELMDDLREWQEAESRTFNPSQTLIFEIL